MSLIKCVALEKSYSDLGSGISGVDFEIQSGEFVFVAGASGAGKSTLLRILYGAELPTAGDFSFCNRRIVKHRDWDRGRLRRQLGIVFQDYGLLPYRNVVENVTLTLSSSALSRKDKYEQARSTLASLGMDNLATKYPSELSGGEQQRVAIARALIHKPTLLVADEPTGNLDPKMSRKVFDLFLQAHSEGITVVLATHDVAMIETLNMRTLVLDQGKLIGDYLSSHRIQ